MEVRQSTTGERLASSIEIAELARIDTGPEVVTLPLSEVDRTDGSTYALSSGITAVTAQKTTTGSLAEVWRTEMDVEALAELLHETEEHHGSFEAVAPPHDWWDWYAAYMDARERGSAPEEAAAVAGRYMADVKHVVAVPA